MTQATKTRKLQISGFIKPSGTIVASVINDRNETYFVQVFASGKITCKHNGKQCKGRKYTGHCYHVDGVKAAKLLSFAQVTAVLSNDYDVVGEALKVFNQATTDLAIGDAYEVLAPTKKVSQVTYPSATGSCGHYVKPEHAGTPCGACLCK